MYGKFQRFNAIDGSIEMLKMIDFRKFQLQRPPLKKSIRLSKPDKILLRLWNKNFRTKI